VVTPDEAQLQRISLLRETEHMKVIAMVLAGASLVAAGSAAASDRVSDLDYLKASRCKGIAVATGADTAGLDAYLKVAERGRQSVVVERGENELLRAKREAKGDRKDRIVAELTGACSAYTGAGKDMAAR
jgi:hypothetical protein